MGVNKAVFIIGIIQYQNAYITDRLLLLYIKGHSFASDYLRQEKISICLLQSLKSIPDSNNFSYRFLY